MILKNSSQIRQDFPTLQKLVYNKPLVYLDSAATTLKPLSVIQRLGDFYKNETSNVHRGAHYLSDQATQSYENARIHVQNFIGAKEAREIIFTRGTTESINLVADTLAQSLLKPNDEILVSEMEHHANIVPWQLACKKSGAVLKTIPITPQGELDLSSIDKILTSKTKILALTHCSNVLGTINNISHLIQKAHAHGAYVLIDAAQSAQFIKLNVQELDCDFLVFSGHKIFAPFGIGVLYGKEKLLEMLPPYQGGGVMIQNVSFKGTTFNEIPYKFEAGTPPIAEAIALDTALIYVESIGLEKIFRHEKHLLQYAQNKIKNLPEVKIWGAAHEKASILSFTMNPAHPSDVAAILDKEGIAVRSGHLCAQPLMSALGITGTIRASFSIYTNEQDIDQFIQGLQKAREFFL